VLDTWVCFSGVVEVLKLPLWLLLARPPRLLLRDPPCRKLPPRAVLVSTSPAAALAVASPGAVHLSIRSLHERGLEGSAHARATACRERLTLSARFQFRAHRIDNGRHASQGPTLMKRMSNF